MYIPNPYFKNIPQIGNLVLDYIFLEDGYPILFTCVTDNRMFLCLCRTLTPTQKWILSEIRFQDLEKLIKNEFCIRDAFKSFNQGKTCIVNWNKDFISETYEVIPTAYLSNNELPSADVYLDEDDEAEVYLEQVRNRIQYNIEKSIQVELSSEESITTDTVSFVELLSSKENSYEVVYKPRTFKFNTLASVSFSVNNELVDNKITNNKIDQDASDNIAPAA